MYFVYWPFFFGVVFWFYEVVLNATGKTTIKYMYNSANMKTSCHGNDFRITGPLREETTGDRWIPLTKGQQCGLWVFSLLCAWTICKQLSCRWFETPWRSRNDTVMTHKHPSTLLSLLRPATTTRIVVSNLSQCFVTHKYVTEVSCHWFRNWFV